MVQYSDSHGTGSTGTETVLLNIEVIAVLCLDMVDFSFNLAVEKVQPLSYHCPEKFELDPFSSPNK